MRSAISHAHSRIVNLFLTQYFRFFQFKCARISSIPMAGPRTILLYPALVGTFCLACLVFLCVQDHRATLATGAHFEHAQEIGRSLLSKEDDADRIAKAKRSIPRRNFKNEDVSANFDPGNQDYWEGIAVYAIVCVSIAVLCLLFGLVFWLCRCCCNCCGGRGAFSGCCCPSKGKPRTYTTCERWWIRIGIFIFAVCIVAMASMGYAANSDFTSGVDNFLKGIVDEMTIVVNDVSSFTTKLTTAASNSNINVTKNGADAAESLRKALDSVKTTVESLRKDVRTYNGYRELALNIAFAWGLLMAAFSFLGALCNCGWPEYIPALLGFFTLFLMWLLFGIQFPVSILCGDFCYAINIYIDDRKACETLNDQRNEQNLPEVDCSDKQYTPNGEVFNDVVKCTGKDSREDIMNAIWGAMSILLYGRLSTTSWYDPTASPTNPKAATLRYYLRYCGYSTDFELYGKYRPATCTGDSCVGWTNISSTVYGNGNKTSYIDLSKATTVKTAVSSKLTAGTCTGPLADDTTQAATWEKYFDNYAEYVALDTEMMRLTSCTYVLAALEKIQDKFCFDALLSLDLIVGAFGATALLFFFGVFFSILGIKRFKKKNKRVKEEPENGTSRQQVEMHTY
eukprot:TRINITY_DN457_c0_g1_i7.p1 TRINITY_DN457_c0_g1~~TRINITY_DN457_c0_g1_i7.p1  ORF type:complete len:625 (-),score=132.66 TRINITY_DN457_c0_g1_i7:702-2576(-)